MNGIEALLEVLAAHGVRYIFGNPGSTELPFNEALVDDDRFSYILGVHEVPLVAMADGYALASGDLGVACVHICCGLGNSMGMLYNAHIEGSPLLLLAGQQDRRLRFGEPVLAGDMISVTRPWTKWACEVERVQDVPAAVRRAVQTALTPPTGPVFLSLPVDLQRETLEAPDLAAPRVPDRRFRPPASAVRQAAALLLQATRPAILAGSRVTEAGASAALTGLAERLGAPVYTESTAAQGRRPMRANHPLYAGPVSMWAPDINATLSPHDVLLAVGADLFRLYIHCGDTAPMPPDTCLIHLDADPQAIGRIYPANLGMLGDPRAGLEEIAAAVEASITPAYARQAQARRDDLEQRRTAVRAEFAATLSAERERRPMSLLTCLAALCRPLPDDVAIVEEAISTHHSSLERLGVPMDPAAYFAHRGWALGWGLGCAVGVKLAWPERPVAALLGDGSALFGIQGLWTAAHYRLPVVFVITNNAQYGILKMGGRVMGLPRMSAGQHVGIDLVEPEVDFVAVAQGLGVEAYRITEPDELTDRMAEGLQGDRPVLLDVSIER